MSDASRITTNPLVLAVEMDNSSIKPILLSNVYNHYDKSDDDDDMSLESGEEQQVNNNNDSTDDALYDDLDEQPVVVAKAESVEEQKSDVPPDNGGLNPSNTDVVDATTVWDDSTSSFKEVQGQIDTNNSSFGETILQLLLDVVGLENRSSSSSSSSATSNSTYSNSNADPTTACSTLSQRVLRQLHRSGPSVTTTQTLLNSIACAFVQCASLIMSSSISTTKTHNLDTTRSSNNNITNVNHNRGYTAAIQATPTIVMTKDDDESQLSTSTSLQEVRQGSMMTLICLLTYFISNLGTSNFTELIFPPIQIDDSNNLLEENLLGDFKVDVIFIAITRVRDILEPMLMYIIPLVIRWNRETTIDTKSPSSSSSPSADAVGNHINNMTTNARTKRRRKLSNTPGLDNYHALTLKRYLVTLGEIQWKLDSSCHSYYDTVAAARNEGNLLQSHMIHLFLIDLATQQKWSFKDVGLIPKVASNNEGHLELLIESHFSSVDSEKNPLVAIVDMSMVQTWLQEAPGCDRTVEFSLGFAEQIMQKNTSSPSSKKVTCKSSPSEAKPSSSLPKSRWGATLSMADSTLSPPLKSPKLEQVSNGSNNISEPRILPAEVEQKSQLAVTSATTNTSSSSSNNNNSNNKYPTPISALNQWYQQGFGISTMKKNLHTHGANFSWTCVFICPITLDAFPSGHYGPNYTTDPQTGVVWHSSRKEAEHAAAARMVDSLAAVQHWIPPGCERLALSTNQRYCSDVPLPIDMHKYINTYQSYAAGKTAKANVN